MFIRKCIMGAAGDEIVSKLIIIIIIIIIYIILFLNLSKPN